MLYMALLKFFGILNINMWNMIKLSLGYCISLYLYMYFHFNFQYQKCVVMIPS